MAINADPKPYVPGCNECGGHGVTSRHLTFSHKDRPVTASVGCYCQCPVGRWVMRQHEQRSPDVRRRMIDLDDPRNGHLRPPDLKASPTLGNVVIRSAAPGKHPEKERIPPAPNVATLPPPAPKQPVPVEPADEDLNW